MDLNEARAILVDHAKNPRNHLKKGEALSINVARGECRNPLCGDFVRVFVTREKSRLVHVALEVQGCTICTASASMMSENIRGRLESEAMDLKQAFADILVTSDGETWPAGLEAFRAFSHLRINPSRVPCALIPWYALKEALA